MVNHDFFKAIEEVCEEKGLEKEEILVLVEKGLVNAYKRETGKANAGVKFNEETGEIFGIPDKIANGRSVLEEWFIVY